MKKNTLDFMKISERLSLGRILMQTSKGRNLWLRLYIPRIFFPWEFFPSANPASILDTIKDERLPHQVFPL